MGGKARCSFCRKGEGPARSVLKQYHGHICEECIRQCVILLKAKGRDLIQEGIDEYLIRQRVIRPVASKDKLVFCTFCQKSQNEVEHIIAGSGVYICNECVQVCLNVLEESGSDIVQSRVDRDAETGSKLVRAVTLPPEYYQAGLALLGYFGVLLRHKFPTKAVRAQLELEGFTVRLVVRFNAGRKKDVESLLSNYGLTVQGKLRPDQLLTDAGQAEALAQRLSISAQEFRRILETERAGVDRADGAGSMDEKVGRLHDALGWVLRREVEDVEGLFYAALQTEP